MQHNKPSAYLILLSSIILILGIFMLVLVYTTEESLHSDAKLINEAGIVRGSIQRVTKLVLSDPMHPPNKTIFENIDDLLNNLIMENTTGEGRYQQALLENSLRLKGHWMILEGDLMEYQFSPSEQLGHEILTKSEECWEIAVSVVLMAQLVTEEKVGGIKKQFYLILMLSLTSGILLTFLLFLYVRRKLEYGFMHDSLTNLFNRRAYERIIETEVIRDNRYHPGLSLILFDIDHFKRINDVYGHQEGDQVLILISEVVSSRIRRTDSLFRIGGEEFAIICPGITCKEAYILAEKIRTSVKKYSLLADKSITISLGVSELDEGRSKEQIFKQADQALYRSKNSGRDRTEAHCVD